MDAEKRKEQERAGFEKYHAYYMDGPAFHQVPAWRRWTIGSYLVASGLTLLGMLGLVLDRLSSWELIALLFGVSCIPAFWLVSKNESAFYRGRERFREELSRRGSNG